MGANSNVAVTAGAGTLVDTFLPTAGDHQQIIRQARADAGTTDNWTVATTAVTSRIAADINRVGMFMVNTSSGRVYIRWDTTAPTAALYHRCLFGGDQYEVPDALCQLVVSVLGEFANGNLITFLPTAS